MSEVIRIAEELQRRGFRITWVLGGSLDIGLRLILSDEAPRGLEGEEEYIVETLTPELTIPKGVSPEELKEFLRKHAPLRVPQWWDEIKKVIG